MNSMPGHELPQLPPPPVEIMLPVEPENVLDRPMTRRGMLRGLRSAVVVTGVAVVAPGLIVPESADAQPETEESPAPEPQDSSESSKPALNNTTNEDANTDQPFTPEEREKTKAETENLEADTKLKQKELERLEKELEPKPWLQTAGDTALKLFAIGGIAGAVTTAGVGVYKHFDSKKKDRAEAEEARRIEENEQRQREDDSYRGIVGVVGDRLNDLAKANIDFAKDEKIPSYAPLLTAYSQLETFVTNPRFSDEIFNLTVAQLRSRSNTIPEMHPVQIKARENTDRQVIRYMASVHKNLPREDAEGNAVLPDAAGVNFEKLRYMRYDLAELNLEGAWMRDLTITGSLAGSRLRVTRFAGSTFGEPSPDLPNGGICDLRGANFSEAELSGAHFEYVLVNKDTRFGEGLNGDPRVTFGNIVSDGSLSDDELKEKIAAAKDAIKQWEKDHPDAEPLEQTAARQAPQSRTQKLLGALGLGK